MGTIEYLVVIAVCLVVLLGTGSRIGVGLGVTGLFLLYAFGSSKLAINTINVIFDTFNSFILTALPLFIFMGEVLLRCGLGGRLYTGMTPWVSRLPGGLIQTNIAACTIFAACSGSSVATAATMGTIAYSEQAKRGYDTKLILGSLAGAGTLGLLIPPSITLLVYGGFVGESIGKLFIGGIVPGLIYSFLFMTYIGVRCSLQPQLTPRMDEASWKTRLLAIADMGPVLLLVFMILGGIYFGVVTPTEAAAAGAFMAMVLGAVYRKLTFQVLRDALMGAAQTTGMLMMVVIGALILQFAIGDLEVPRQVATFLVSLPVNRMVIMGMLYVLYLGLGCLFDGVSMMLLTLPIVYPVVLSLGFDSVWFGVVLTILIEIAQITPPVGMNLFALHGITKRPIKDIVYGSFPFFALLLAGIALWTAIPDLVLWLPNHMIAPAR